MKNVLEFFRADLQMQVEAFCKHIRANEYDSEDGRLSTIFLLGRTALLVNEIEGLLASHARVVKALEDYLAGRPFTTYYREEEAETIWQFCLYYFETPDKPLGKASDELSQWVDSYSERHRLLNQAFDQLFPGVELSIIEQSEDGEQHLRSATPKDVGEIQTKSQLRAIEQTFALTDLMSRWPVYISYSRNKPTLPRSWPFSMQSDK